MRCGLTQLEHAEGQILLFLTHTAHQLFWRRVRVGWLAYCASDFQMRHVDLVDLVKEQADSSGQWKALPKFPREAGKPWATIWPGPEHIIFGHHARRRLQVKHKLAAEPYVEQPLSSKDCSNGS